jgi:hypothetical protein
VFTARYGLDFLIKFSFFFKPESSKIFAYMSRDFVLLVFGFAVLMRKQQKISIALRAECFTTIGVYLYFVGWQCCKIQHLSPTQSLMTLWLPVKTIFRSISPL